MTQMSKKRTIRIADAPVEACCRDLGDLLRPAFFKALCDPTRIALLARLAACGRPCTVGEMAACCPIDLSVVSRHLAMLREAGILEAQRRGKEVYYHVRFDSLVKTLRDIAGAIEACCPPGTGKATNPRKELHR